MNKGIMWVMAALTGVVMIAGLAGCRRSYAKDMDDAFNNLDLQRHTKLHVEEYWKTINNQERRCEGMVVEVRRDRGGAEVFIAVPSRITFRDYNVVLTVPDIAQAAALTKRQKIRFRGILNNYRAGREGGAVLMLQGAEILD